MCRPPRVAESFYAGRRCSIYIVGCTLDTQRNSFRQSVSQLFHGPAPRSPLHRLVVRLRHSRSNTSNSFVIHQAGTGTGTPARDAHRLSIMFIIYITCKIDQNSLYSQHVRMCYVIVCGAQHRTLLIASRATLKVYSSQHASGITTATVYSLALGAGVATRGHSISQNNSHDAVVLNAPQSSLTSRRETALSAEPARRSAARCNTAGPCRRRSLLCDGSGDGLVSYGQLW